MKGLTDRLANIDAAARQGIINTEKEIELKAQLNSQVQMVQIANAKELETNTKLLAVTQRVDALTSGYTKTLANNTVKTAQAKTKTDQQNITLSQYASKVAQVGGAMLNVVHAFQNVGSASGNLATRLGGLVQSLTAAATQAGLSALGPYGAAAGVGLQLFGALTQKKPQAEKLPEPPCGKDPATGDPCSQPMVDEQKKTTMAVTDQTSQLLEVERYRRREAELNNQLIREQQQLAQPRSLNDILSVPGNSAQGSPVVVKTTVVNVTDPDDAIDRYMHSERGENTVLNRIMDNQDSVRDAVT